MTTNNPIPAVKLQAVLAPRATEWAPRNSARIALVEGVVLAIVGAYFLVGMAGLVAGV